MSVNGQSDGTERGKDVLVEKRNLLPPPPPTHTQVK